MTALVCAIPLIASLFAACDAPRHLATGYAEGEFVQIAPVATAQVAGLNVTRGNRVAAGTVVATMENKDALAAKAAAEAALARAESQLADLREGRRPEEIRVIEASLASATAQAEEAGRSAARLASLAARGAATAAQAEDAATAAQVARARVAEIEANLAVARLPARPQEIAAAEAAVTGARAELERAAWTLAKRDLVAPADGIVSDIIRHPGEIAGPSAPVLTILPDGAVRLRLYVPEADISRVAVGSRLALRCDGCPPDLSARVTYVADGPEFTPPVIYSLQNRQKLVYMIEALPEGPVPLKPGQIVDADLAASGG
ncbi:MAG: HlyD family efflux transporter periplasmic adaptor subunit [Rhodobacteraceae bacterium]|nr:HlyD family efflux transporter periplasmic adaptor subunit [Paracoccaceae bacterium]